MITSARYLESGAIFAAIDGVSIGVPDDPANRHRQMIAEWEADGNVIAPYEAPPASAPATPVVVCLANFQIDGGDIASMEDGATGLSFAFATAPNIFWLYFAEPLPDTNYSPQVSASSGMARVTDRQTDHIEITVAEPTEPYALFTQIFRTT